MIFLTLFKYPEDIINFLKSEGHMRRTRDYCIFQKNPKENKPEAIVITYLLDEKTNIRDILVKWEEFLSPPVRTL